MSHTFTPQSAVFDEDNLVSCAGLVPVMALAEQAGLSELLANKIHIAAPRVKSGSANPAPKLATPFRSVPSHPEQELRCPVHRCRRYVFAGRVKGDLIARIAPRDNQTEGPGNVDNNPCGVG